MSYTRLEVLKPFRETAFRRFYDEMLSNEVFAQHFRGPEHVEELMRRLAETFDQSINDSPEQLFLRYRRIGILHFHSDIPYEVFVSGARLLCSVFTEMSTAQNLGAELVLLTEEYFQAISEAMAKGFFDEFISENLREVENLATLVKTSSSGGERHLIVRHYRWLARVLAAVRDEDPGALRRLVSEELADEQTVLSYIRAHLSEISSVYREEDIERIRFRLLVNANSIAFYLQRRVYTEALALIVNLLEVYKLTLILDSVVSNIVVRKAELLIEEKSRLSETDPLTEVFNRRKMDRILEGLVLRSHRIAQPLTLCILDIDDFKQINDRFGHLVGDNVLVELAHLLKQSVRQHDFVARFGGEEFALVLADTGLANARCVAEKIRERVAARDWIDVGRITISVGLAELRPEDDERSLFRRADVQLYQAKLAGKNQVCG